MTAISKAFVDAADTAIDPDSPIDTTLITGFRDSLRHLREWVGASYYAGAAQDHNHDGTNSAVVQIGANYLRNGSFEAGTAGWTQVNYTGGSQAIDTANAMDGVQCLAITSTVLANGGGYAQTSEYEEVTAGRVYSILGNIKGSVANVSSKAEIIWFDSTKTQISASTVYSSSATPTTATDFTGFGTAPTNAKYKQLRITGGVPATGSATGTVYFDGLVAVKSIMNPDLPPVVAGDSCATVIFSSVQTASLSAVELSNSRIVQGGTWRIGFSLSQGSGSSYTVYAQIYKNGIAFGTLRASTSTTPTYFSEDLSFANGDTLQFFAYTTSSSTPSIMSNAQASCALLNLVSAPNIITIGKR